jgi:hypothetical protein
MKHIRALFTDPKRSQRGSVLSGVLIMTAFIAIIAGALMTALSTNFLLSRHLVTRVANEATLNSAMETTMSQLGAAQLNQPCPATQSVTLNNRTAVPTYQGCWPTVRENPKFAPLPGTLGAAFNVDGTTGPNGDYVVGDAGGNIFDYRFASGTLRWTLGLGGSVTASPLVFAKQSPGPLLDVIPLSGPACAGSGFCLNIRLDNNSSTPPTQQCSIPTSAAVTTQPVASSSIAGLVYYADGTNLEANDVSTSGTNCDVESTPLVLSQPIASGPVAVHCSTGCGGNADFIYVVISNGTTSQLVEVGYHGGLSRLNSWLMPWGNPSGMALQGANLAITFGGGVALYRISSNGSVTFVNKQSLPGVADAPYWCSQCGNLLGVGAQDGGLYLFDSLLNAVTNYAGTGSAINTTPGADGAGNWYFGAADGFVHEVQVQAGQMIQVNQYGPVGQVGSSVQVGGCGTGICVYLGSLNHNLYRIPMDARDAVLWACINTCTSANPRLWAQVEIAYSTSPTTVHVQGWSYYSA